MRDILPPISAAKQLCKPPALSGALRPAHQSVRVPCADGLLLYQALTGELLLLSGEEAGREASDPALREELRKRLFLVPEDFDEYAYSRQLRAVLALMNPVKGITGFTVFTTTECNARCPYCYEKGCRRVPMSDKVAHDTADFIRRASGGDKVSITWFGGEPLFNRRAIEIITRELRGHAQPFRSRMVSNGYLFDAETVRMAKEDWLLERVQITLDGTEERYNRTKGFIYREGSAYQRVLQNIERLLDADIRVVIRLNVSLETMGDFHALTDELAERFTGEKKPGLYAKLLRDFGRAGLPEMEDGALSAWNELEEHIFSSGLGSITPISRSLRINGCMADNDACVTVLPDGRLGKCEHETDQRLVGSIYEGVTDAAMAAKWKEHVEVPACRTCAYAPYCFRTRLCDWSRDRCTEADREEMRMNLRRMILGEYRRFLAGETDKGETTDETEADLDFSAFR